LVGLERLEYAVRAGEPAAVTLTHRIADLVEQRARSGGFAELSVDAVVLQADEG
jgi:hypothetical protein